MYGRANAYVMRSCACVGGDVGLSPAVGYHSQLGGTNVAFNAALDGSLTFSHG